MFPLQRNFCLPTQSIVSMLVGNEQYDHCRLFPRWLWSRRMISTFTSTSTWSQNTWFHYWIIRASRRRDVRIISELLLQYFVCWGDLPTCAASKFLSGTKRQRVHRIVKRQSAYASSTLASVLPVRFVELDISFRQVRRIARPLVAKKKSTNQLGLSRVLGLGGNPLSQDPYRIEPLSIQPGDTIWDHLSNGTWSFAWVTFVSCTVSLVAPCDLIQIQWFSKTNVSIEYTIVCGHAKEVSIFHSICTIYVPV